MNVTAQELSGQTRVSLKSVVAMVAFALPLLGAAYVAHNDVVTLKTEVSELRSKTSGHDAGIAEIKQDIRGMQEGMKFQTQLLQEIRQEQRELRRQPRR